MGRLVLAPGVERFIQDQEAHLVGEVEQFGRGRIVAGADGVAAHVAEHLELPLQGADIDGGAQGAEIVVVADAVEFEVLAVDEEAGVGVVLDGADAEGGFVGIDDGAVLGDGGDGDVTIGRLGAPELGVGDCRPGFDGCRALARGDRR